jgi:hypothetical protein
LKLPAGVLRALDPDPELLQLMPSNSMVAL